MAGFAGGCSRCVRLALRRAVPAALLVVGLVAAQVPAPLAADLPEPVRDAVDVAVTEWLQSAEVKLDAARLAVDLASGGNASAFTPTLSLDASLLPAGEVGGSLAASWAWLVVNPTGVREEAKRVAGQRTSAVQRVVHLDSLVMEVVWGWLSLWRSERQTEILDALALRPAPREGPDAVRYATLLAARDAVAFDALWLAEGLSTRLGIPVAWILGRDAWESVLASHAGSFCPAGDVNVLLARDRMEAAGLDATAEARAARLPVVRAGVQGSLAATGGGTAFTPDASGWFSVGAPSGWPFVGSARVDVGRDAVSLSLSLGPDEGPSGSLPALSLAAERDAWEGSLRDAERAARRDAFELEGLVSTRALDWAALRAPVVGVASADAALQAVDRLVRGVELVVAQALACGRAEGAAGAW